MAQDYQRLPQEGSREDPRRMSPQRRAVRKVGSRSGVDEPHSASRVHRDVGGTSG